MNIWLNISFQIPEAHLSDTSSKFSSHLMQPDNISANTVALSVSGLDEWRLVQSLCVYMYIYIFFFPTVRKKAAAAVSDCRPTCHLHRRSTSYRRGRRTEAGSWQSTGNSPVTADSISLLTKLISQCPPSPSSPSGWRSGARLTPGDVRQSERGSTVATAMGYDGQRLAMAASR